MSREKLYFVQRYDVSEDGLAITKPSTISTSWPGCFFWPGDLAIGLEQARRMIARRYRAKKAIYHFMKTRKLQVGTTWTVLYYKDRYFYRLVEVPVGTETSRYL